MEQLELAPFQSWKEMDEVNAVLGTRSEALSIESEAKIRNNNCQLPKLDLPMSRKSSVSSISSSSSSSDDNNNNDDDYRPTGFKTCSHVPTRVLPMRTVRMKRSTIAPTIVSENAHVRKLTLHSRNNCNSNNNVVTNKGHNSTFDDRTLMGHSSNADELLRIPSNTAASRVG